MINVFSITWNKTNKCKNFKKVSFIAQLFKGDFWSSVSVWNVVKCLHARITNVVHLPEKIFSQFYGGLKVCDVVGVPVCFGSEIKTEACWHNKHTPTPTHRISPERQSEDGHMSQEVDQGLWLLKHTLTQSKTFQQYPPKTAGFWKELTFQLVSDLYWQTEST